MDVVEVTMEVDCFVVVDSCSASVDVTAAISSRSDTPEVEYGGFCEMLARAALVECIIGNSVTLIAMRCAADECSATVS